MNEPKKRSRFAEVWRRLKKNKLAIVSLIILILLFVVAIIAPYIAPYSYDETDYSQSFAGPSSEHLLGTDRLGRDILSRLLWGSRQSLQMGLYSTVLAAVLGIIIGSIAGYYGGVVDNLLMRFLDIYQGIPMFLLCVTLAAVLGPSLRNAVIAIGISSVPLFARLMRASVLTIGEAEYIESARAISMSNTRIIMKHLIPNAISPLIVSITMNMGSAVLAGAGLSFIGLGIEAPMPEWGAMISDARSFLRGHGMLAVYPGICIMVTVLAFNLLGDGLRDALDPRLKN